MFESTKRGRTAGGLYLAALLPPAHSTIRPPMLPEWAPNLHPLIVHFPIALLCTAALVDVFAQSETHRPWMHEAATGLYLLGAVSALAAFFSGREAAEALNESTEVLTVLNAHADGALVVVWLYGLLALLRIGLRELLPDRRWLRWLLTGVGVAGLWFVVQTATHGAELVYRFGIGVSGG